MKRRQKIRTAQKAAYRSGIDRDINGLQFLGAWRTERIAI